MRLLPRFFNHLGPLRSQWQTGRRHTGYRKRRLFEIGCADAYLLHYPVGASVPAHTDPVTDRRHYRFNIELLSANAGGELICTRPIFRAGPLTLFRSDISEHAVTEVLDGNRWVLSFGYAPKRKP